MERYRQFQPVLIEDFETSRWRHPRHSHNHYELIYIKDGSGRHYVNQSCYSYETGDIYLLGPEEEHHFEIDRRTRFIYLKFTDLYIHQRRGDQFNKTGPLEYLLRSRETHFPNFKFNAADQICVAALIDVMISLKHDVFANEEIILMQVLALAIMIQRNMSESKPIANRSHDMQALFSYVHQHIYTPEKLKAAVMASHFNLAPGYIGPYFKRNAGITLRDYVQEYRKMLIRQRMDSGSYSLKQIANEFKLVDESHVKKILKNKRQTSVAN